LIVVTPSTPYDAKGLLNTAILDENPVLFFEHKKLLAVTGDVPEEYYTIPFGKADLKRPGRDMTIVATHAMVHRSLSVADMFAKEGIEIEILDPRTLKPLDKESILGSAKKTGRVIVADEGPIMCGVASEISAMIAEEAIEYLQAPILRVGSPDAPVPTSPPLEKAYIPDEDDLIKAVQKMKAFF
jgi:pyruvate dehydrogenase E1 component beta subunit